MLNIHLTEAMLSRTKSMNHERYEAVVFGETCELIHVPICILKGRGQALKQFY